MGEEPGWANPCTGLPIDDEMPEIVTLSPDIDSGRDPRIRDERPEWKIP